MLKQRILTATILIISVLIVLFLLPSSIFALVTAVATGLAAWEWSYVMGLQYRSHRIFYVIFVLWMLAGLGLTPAIATLTLASFIWLIGLFCVISYGRNGYYKAESVFFKGLAGVMALMPCWLGINLLRSQPKGSLLVLLLLLLVWAADIGAYFAGSRYGKHLLLVKVSPKKTIEGVVGGIMASTVVACIGAYSLKLSIQQALLFILIALVSVLFSVVGDLFESVLKRQQGIKDSGNILPGHGGILDRIDSLTAATPIFALSVFLLGIGK